MALSKTELPYNHNVVDGLIVPVFVTQTRVDDIKQKLSLSAGDVVIASYQKSGTTWLQHIVKLLRNDGKEDGKVIPRAIPWLEMDASDADSPYYRQIESMARPIYVKSHMPYELIFGVPPHSTQAKYIYIARNPKDVAVSYFHHMLAFTAFDFSGSWDEFFDLYLAGRVPFGSWFDHVLGWWKYRDAKNVLFLKYEDFITNLSEGVQKIAGFIFGNVPQPSVIDEVVKQCSFDSMKANPTANFSWAQEFRHPDQAPFMRRGKVGDWRNYFSAEQNAVFDVLYAEKMKDSRLDFEF